MKLILLSFALLLMQTACAANGTQDKSEKKGEKAVKADTAKVVKTPPAPPTPPAPLFTDIIPQPRSLVKGEGRLTIDERTVISCDKGVEKIADYLTEYIHIERSKSRKSGSIHLALDEKLGKEEYSLIINKKGIEVRGGDYGGVFNGAQSLLQLLPHTIYSKTAQLPMDVSYIEVKDAPQYHYRGFLLDVARTFQPVHEVKRVIDYMALCKLNKLHFHLVDNPAWRIEIKKYPDFAKVGGFRGGDSPLHPIYSRFHQKYGGYYTQEELRDIVAYAAVRNIEVIPEIDMPGHSKALGVVHPDILCNYKPNTSQTNGIDIRNVWCVAKESNYAIIEDIIKELVEIFPSEYIHIGGDEVSFAQWKRCPDCQKLMAQKGLNGGEQLEQHFLNRVSSILSKYNRKAVVWDEAVSGGLLDKSTLVCGWRNRGKGWQSSIKNGYSTIVMPSAYFYLDSRQSTHERGHRSTMGLDLKKLCGFNLNAEGVTEEHKKHIAGIEGAFWGEIYLINIDPKGHFSDYLEYMLFPRIFAVSEIGWSTKRRSYDEMLAILKSNYYNKLHAMSATFRLESPVVKIENGKLFASTSDGSKLYYKDIRTNKALEYKAPLDAGLAPFVTFQSRLMTGYSNDTGAPAFYNTKRPSVKITSSMPFQTKRPLENCATYKGQAYTTRCAKKGDWVEYRFATPLKCAYLKVPTGYEHLHRCLIYKGHLEVSYDGKTFAKVGNLTNGYFILRPKMKPIYALRLVADGISDAEEKVIIQPLEIR